MQVADMAMAQVKLAHLARVHSVEASETPTQEDLETTLLPQVACSVVDSRAHQQDLAAILPRQDSVEGVFSATTMRRSQEDCSGSSLRALPQEVSSAPPIIPQVASGPTIRQMASAPATTLLEDYLATLTIRLSLQASLGRPILHLTILDSALGTTTLQLLQALAVVCSATTTSRHRQALEQVLEPTIRRKPNPPCLAMRLEALAQLQPKARAQAYLVPRTTTTPAEVGSSVNRILPLSHQGVSSAILVAPAVVCLVRTTPTMMRTSQLEGDYLVPITPAEACLGTITPNSSRRKGVVCSAATMPLLEVSHSAMRTLINSRSPRCSVTRRITRPVGACSVRRTTTTILAHYSAIQ